MIFETAEKLVDEKTGELKQVSQPFWIAKRTQAETDKFTQTEELKANISTLNEVVKINERYRQGEIELEAAISARSKALEGCSDEVKTLGNSSELTADQIDVWSRKQEKQIEASDKAKNRFKNLGKEMSAATKSMLGNMGIDLAAAALVSFVKWGFGTLNEKFGLTKSVRASHMEETLNTYNDAIKETESNLQSISSVADEFNKLSAGVGLDGKNISLSADEYSRYNEIVSELVALNPSLVEGYTTEGNAIVNKTTALQDCIKAQEDYKKSATETYIASGSDIIKGANDNIRDSKDELTKAAKTFSKTIGGRDLQHFDGSMKYNDTIIAEALERDVDLYNPSASDFDEIIKKREKIIALTIEEKGWNQANAQDREKINQLNEDFITMAATYRTLEESSKPKLDWINTYVSQMNEIGEVASSESQSILNKVPESLRTGYQAALKEIAMDTSLSMDDMKVQATTVAQTLSEIYNNEEVNGISTSTKIEVDGEEKIISYKQAVKKAQEAKDEFDDSLGDSTAVSEYNKATETQVETLNSLADKWDEVDETISASLRAQASEIEDYASENALTLEKALNPLNEYISTARTAAKSLKENWEENVVGNDVNTAINAYESIYDEVMDGFDNAGNGTNAFWTAAAEFLGTDTLEEYGYDIDKVNKKMKSLSGIMGDSEQNSWNFFKMLKNNKDTLNELIVDKDGNFKEIVEVADNGAISFDIDSGDIDEVADALNVSRNLLVSLIDNARHWSDIDLSNGDEVETAIREMDSTWEDGSGTAYQFQDSIVEAADAAGLSVSEVYKKMKELNDVKILDLSKFNSEDTIGEITQDFIEMNSILGKKDGSDGFKMNANAIISQMNAMGRSADETTNILEKLEEQGWIDEESLKNRGNESWSEYVEPKFNTLDDSDPFSKMANSVDKIVYGIDAIIVALGGVPTNLKFETNLDEIAYDITNLGSSESYTQEQKDTVQDKINWNQSYYKDILKNANAQGNKEIAIDAKNALNELDTLQQKLDGLDDEKTVKVQTKITEEDSQAGHALYSEFSKADSWKELSDKSIEKIKNGTLESTFGNIDMDSRKIITWSDALKKTYEKELKSWNYNPEVGGIDTVFGGSDSFNLGGTGETIEIAYSPILNTDGKAIMLGKETVLSYIQQIVDEASKDGNWSLSEILELDQKGLEIDGKQISGLIADAGENAGETGALIHFAGDYGAIALAYNDIATAADKAGISTSEFIKQYNELNPDQKIDPQQFEELEKTINVDYQVDGDDAEKTVDDVAEVLDKTPEKVFTELQVATIGEQSLDSFLENLDIAEEDREVVIDAITKYAEGDVEGFQSALDNLPPSLQTIVSAAVDGALGNIAIVDGQLTLVGNKTARATLDAVDLASGKIQGARTQLSNFGMLKATATATVKVVGMSLLEKAKGLLGKLGGGTSAIGTISSPNYRPTASIPSMASGGKRGRLGPNGNGGLTLTGELGTELVWIPSESRSFLVGMYGPEMVNLPGDAVVYPADQTRKIIGDTIHPSRMNFGTGSMAKGNMNFGSMVKGGMTYSGSSSSSSKNNNSGGSSKKTGNSNSKDSKSSNSNKKSAYEKGKEKLDHQLEMSYITEVQYYKKLKSLYNKHKKSLKKNTEDHRKALEDKRKAYIDAYEHEKEILDSRLKRGIISEATYYKKLESLGKKYYTKNGKIRAGFADEWRAWQEDLISAGKNSFDDGMDDLNKQLEDGLITYEKYYKEYLKLKNKYLKTDDDKKDSLEDAKDQLDDYVGDVLDDIEQNIDDGELGLDWGIDKAAGLAQMQILINQIEKIKKKYPEMADACDKAIKEIKRTMKELEKEQFEDEQDKLEEYMDLVEDMLRQEAEDYMDALEDQADAFDDLIDKRKEMLRLAEDEAEFMEGLEDNGNEMARIQKQIDDLSHDDSRAAQAKLAELQEELVKLQKDRTSTIRDETMSKTEDLLDKQSEFYREIIDRQIEVVENWLNNKSAVIEVVIEQIENRDENDLYERLIAYNGKFGDALVGTVAKAWDDIETLTEKYGDDVAKIVEILQKGIDINVHSGFISSSQTDYAETQEKTNGKFQSHHTGLASGFTGDGATLKQNEVWRLLTDDELVLNKEDQMKLGTNIRNYNLIQDAYSGLLKSINQETSSVMPNIEIAIDSPITIEGTATPEVIEQLNQYGDRLATQTLDKLEAALLRNGIRTRAINNSRKL